ncbi:MAG: hypothetical protein HY909_14760 [Deltaproteobacteria bacterium]|nr:hypothetical protein [Deltaproteobacteria bacterium]
MKNHRRTPRPALLTDQELDALGEALLAFEDHGRPALRLVAPPPGPAPRSPRVYAPVLRAGRAVCARRASEGV